ncbi:MAG: MauE/DoxX family redox-associated membrane protein [Syntrophobacteraceae bacterium]
MKRSLFFWLRLILGAIFITAAVDKIINPAAFAKMIFNYQLLPDFLINLCAIILPWLELALGLSLMIGLWLPGAVVLVNVLLLAFLGALVFNLARGLNIHCGCFSTAATSEPATLWYLFRDSAFLLMGGYLFFGVFFSAHLGETASEVNLQN